MHFRFGLIGTLAVSAVIAASSDNVGCCSAGNADIASLGQRHGSSRHHTSCANPA